jgi:hypothetical protein
MVGIKPYQNESQTVSIGGLTIENRTDRVEIYGSLHVTRDKAGLSDAKVFKAILDDIVQALGAERELPERVELTNKARPVKNPFA